MSGKYYGFGLAFSLLALVCATCFYEASGADPDAVVSKPFKVSGGGTVDFLPLDPTGPSAPHNATGNATQLGNYYLVDAAVQIDSFIDPLTANFSSAVDPVFVAANGDKLVLHYEGIVKLTPVLDENNQPTGEFTSRWVADFTPVLEECTGRFEKVVGGSFEMIATSGAFQLSDTDIPYQWKGDGFLDWEE